MMKSLLTFCIGMTVTLMTHGQFVTHSQRVNSISISPDGKHIATAGEDKSLKYWKSNNGKMIKTLVADAVHSFIYSPTGNNSLFIGRYSKCRRASLNGDTVSIGGVFSREGIVDYYMDDDHYIKNQMGGTAKSPYAKIGIVNKNDPTVFLWEYGEKKKSTYEKFEYGGVDNEGRFLIRSGQMYYLFSKDTPPDQPIASFKLKIDNPGRMHISPQGDFFILDGANAKVSLPAGEIEWENPRAFRWQSSWKYVHISSTGDSLVAYDGHEIIYIMDTKTQKLINEIDVKKIESGEISVFDICMEHHLMAYSANNSGDVHVVDLNTGKAKFILNNKRDVNPEIDAINKDLEENRQAYDREAEKGYTHFADNSGLSFYYDFGGVDTNVVFVTIKSNLTQAVQVKFELTFYTTNNDPYQEEKMVKLKPGEAIESWNKLKYPIKAQRSQLRKIIISDILIKYI